MKGFKKRNVNNSFLDTYLQAFPYDGWKEDFYSQLQAVDRVKLKEEIALDQTGLCAYCEISLLSEGDNKPVGFKVEHFIPENSKSIKTQIEKGIHGPFINYSLMWSNLLGCCHGGTHARSRSFKGEFKKKEYYSCDVPKANNDWRNDILNPLIDIPNGITYFEFDEYGHVDVSADCPAHLKLKARNTIDYLNLDNDRMVRLRAATIEILREHSDNDDDIELLLGTDHLGHFGDFISLRRWYLGV